jgi:predicted component of type VI protein secretion system
MRSKILTLILLWISVSVGYAQNQEEVEIKDIIESVAENLPEDYDMTELTEVLSRLKKHPINLNNTSVDELKTLVFLSPLQISNFFNHLQENGKLLDVLELQSIDGFDPETIQRLIPLVTINQNLAVSELKFKDILQKAENDLFIRYARTLQKLKGFKDLPGNRYLGSPERFQLRYRYHYDDIVSVSFTIDKDAGEKFLSKPFDFYSGSLSISKQGSIKKLVMGDYTLQFGQGLTLWSGFSFGKSPDVTTTAKKDLGLRAYTSSNEYAFFRGAAATISLTKNFEITPFVSLRNLDASQTLDIDGKPMQSTINQTGLHRTPTEVKNKNNLSQLVLGTVLQYNKSNFNIGTIAYKTQFDDRFISQTPLYDHFSFTGKSLTNLGLFYSYTFKNIYFFGEGAKSLKGGVAFNNGALISLSRTTALALFYRNYAKDYHSFFNQATSENSESVNERGLYTGLNIVPNKQWSVSFYADYFQFPWLKYRIDAPSKGYEILSQVAYSASKACKILLRYKLEIKQQNTDLELPLNFLVPVKKEGFRTEINWQINKKWKFQNRLEVSQYKKGDLNKEIGFLCYQDVSSPPLFNKLSSNIRVAYFKVPTYNSRIYAYEDDVLYSFAFGMYNGEGIRSYFNLKYKFDQRFDLWIRYALFKYSNVETVGTYLDEIQGNKKADFKLQLRYQF